MRGKALAARLVLGGIKSRLPERVQRALGVNHVGTTGGSTRGLYCYAAWMRHLLHLHPYAPEARWGHVVELGPGDSLGMTLMALLTGGGQRATAVDVLDHTDPARDEAVLGELLGLLRGRAQIPGAGDFPRMKPVVEELGFPAWLSPELGEERARELRGWLRGAGGAGEEGVRRLHPSKAAAGIEAGSADLIFSQAVLEYAADLDDAYRQMARWLRPGGLISHQIDLSSHDTAATWDGHWGYSDRLWRWIRGRRPFFPYRAPASAHVRAAQAAGLEILHTQPTRAEPTLRSEDLAETWRDLSDEDRSTSALYLLARRR